jgi:thiosulfate reductase cytochrome b subunit
MQPVSAAVPPPYYRHRLPVRIMHWINVVSLTILLMSGLQIFNAHPALYWSDDSRDGTRVLQITQKQVNGQLHGITRIGSAEFDTHGVLGTSRGEAPGAFDSRAFPSWATIPGPQWLSMGRLWHFFFAWLFFLNGLCYIAWTVFSGHLRRDLIPTGGEVRGIGGSIRDHLLLRHPHGDDARRYNVLQNIAYLSPMMDSFAPGWVDLLGGRQAARTLHFIAAVLLVAFVLIHVFEVIVTGLVNNLRSMVTGYWRLPK